MHMQIHAQAHLCRLATAYLSALKSGFPTCGARSVRFCCVSSWEGKQGRAPWKTYPKHFDYWCPRFSMPCDCALLLLLSPLTFNHSWVFPIWQPFLTLGVLKAYSDSQITTCGGLPGRRHKRDSLCFPSSFHPSPLHQSPGSRKEMLKSI